MLFARAIYFNDTPPPAISTLSLHDALPIWRLHVRSRRSGRSGHSGHPVRSGSAGLSEHWMVTSTGARSMTTRRRSRSEEHTSELQSLRHLVCRLLLEKKKQKNNSENLLTRR